MENRINRLTAVHVDLAVNVSFAFGLAEGVKSAQELGIDPQVVQRVLIQGGPRRVTPLVTPKPSPGNEQRIQYTGG